jgi:hypothetical protein
MKNAISISDLKACGVMTPVAHYFAEKGDGEKLKEIIETGLSVDVRKSGVSLIAKVIQLDNNDLWAALFSNNKLACAKSVDGLHSAALHGAKDKFEAMIAELNPAQVSKIFKEYAPNWIEDDAKRWALHKCYERSAINFMKVCRGMEMRFLNRLARKMEQKWFLEVVAHLAKNNWSCNGKEEYTVIAELLKNKDYKNVEVLEASGYQMNEMLELIDAIRLNLDIKEVSWLISKMQSVFVQENEWGNQCKVETSEQVDALVKILYDERQHQQSVNNSVYPQGLTNVHQNSRYVSEMASYADSIRRWDLALDFAIKMNRSDIAKILIERGCSPARLIDANKIATKPTVSTNEEIERCLLIMAAETELKTRNKLAL